ncbi:MAG: hypothetical protein WBP56_05680 [Polyangia bacterium]
MEGLVQIGLDAGAEEFFAEPVNPRGRALIHTIQALREAGYNTEAAAVDQIRHEIEWSGYVVCLVGNVQAVLRAQGVLGKLRLLLHTASLTEADAAWIRRREAGVVLLGKEKRRCRSSSAALR